MIKPARSFLLLLILLCQHPLSFAADLASLFNKLNRSVVVIKASQVEIKGLLKAQKTLSGSGVLISADGKILTAAHVVQTAEKIEVQFTNGEVIFAKTLASEPFADVAVIQLEHMPQKPHIATLGDSNQNWVGDQIMVIGAPFGFSHTLSVGYITGLRQGDHMSANMSLAQFFQTDAAINKGNSGGPMFNLKGEVIGIVSHIFSKSGGSDGIGFVVTSNTINTLLLKRNAYWSGIDGVIIHDALAQALNLPQKEGMLIQTVAANSPGYKMGLRAGTIETKIGKTTLKLGGDIILSVEDIPLTRENYRKIQQTIIAVKPDKLVHITYLRAGQVKRASVVR